MHGWWRVVVAALGCVLLLPGAAVAGAPSGSTGRDVSYPQCTSDGASTSTVSGLPGDFGIVGLTGGRPWGPNSCLSSEYLWAAGLANPPALYVNTANPAPTSSYFWPTSGSSAPALCKDASSTTDPGCAYDYGWQAAQDALQTESANVPTAAALPWWLDIETANSWNGDGLSNAADLQGMTDYLRSHGIPQVGLYATSAQWVAITGGYNPSTVAAYAAAWQSEFTASYPMTDAPIWVAGLDTAADAFAACGTSFAGGPTQLAQYEDASGDDADLVCGPPEAAASEPSP